MSEEDLYARIRDLRDCLRMNGFVPCDSPACNCGSWHARFGLRERMDEVASALGEAGHPLCNGNGNLALNALMGLIAERDVLRHALKIIAGKAQSADNLMSNVDIAVAALENSDE